MSSSTPPRRFKVEPLETSSKSSKDRPQADDHKPPRRFAPELVETTTKSNRRFAPEPVETTHKPSRRFAPEPVETTTRSSRSGERARRFKPEPIETTASSNRKQESAKENFIAAPSSQSKRTPRKFTPQLIATAKRTRKAGDTEPAILPSDKTEVTLDSDSHGTKQAWAQPTSMPSAPGNTPTMDYAQNPLFLEIQRAASPQAMRQLARARTRSHHSFRVPSLEPIESSESEADSIHSPSTSPSVHSDGSYTHKGATGMRESVDGGVSGYLLQVAARAAEKQLHEQAMAAFPNDDHHEPVQHFIGRDSEETGSFLEEARRSRGVSFNEVNWELIAIQQHREEQEQRQEADREKKRRREAELNKPDGVANRLWGGAASLQHSSKPRNVVGGYQKDGELDCQRKSARPPMLGKDIIFPRCPSPEPARFDSTQGCDATRLAMCYLSEQSLAAEKGEGLWCGGGKSQPNKVPSLWSCANSRPPSPGGLWAGSCLNSGTTPPRGPSGLLTPHKEMGNPLETPCPTPARTLLPPTPPASHADFACIDEKLAMEVTIEEEFGDDFVTQVYNYLSLGYPAIARNFDGELAKIAHVPVAELRQDDHLAKSTGYLRLGEDGNLKHADISEESCARWRALRVYVQEWARQQPNMADAGAGAGITVRKGSWAL
ncbi:hypothetical protein K504DRAFT_460481 [Pleomassaria siparia CBS 279.74]|uniref:Uncharacterized protein n=1 Tax=Pleomassaria siparia CBS 279.74 TaxID=1314801 RepID=A0A6G1JXK9_9PLEO|nr:hypothetical protein K504DRAFT_460481 [Pleomassaria siparia CBS 279.74]